MKASVGKKNHTLNIFQLRRMETCGSMLSVSNQTITHLLVQIVLDQICPGLTRIEMNAQSHQWEIEFVFLWV